MPEKSSLEEALARITGATPKTGTTTPAAGPPGPTVRAVPYKPAADVVDLGGKPPPIDKPTSFTFGFSDTPQQLYETGVKAAAAAAGIPPEASKAARERYNAAMKAATASLPAGAQPVETKWTNAGQFPGSTQSFTASAYPYDPALFTAMESARRDYYSAAGLPYQQVYQTAAEVAAAHGYGPPPPGTVTRQVAMPLGGFKTISEGPGYYKENYNYTRS